MVQTQKQLFLAFLEDGYPLEDVKQLNLEGFDWSCRSEDGRTLLVLRIHKALKDSATFADAIRAIEWLIHSGASIEQECTGGHSSFFWSAKPEVPRVRVDCKGHNAISYVRAMQQKMRDNLSEWKVQVDFLNRVLKTFAVASGQSAAGPRVSIHEGIAQLWEKSLAAKDSHDLTIETADGVVTAHAHMLKAASPVVAAMLESPMKEGNAKRVEVKDTSSKAVSLFMEMIVYTCSAQAEPDHKTALGMITDESFVAITDEAVLKGLERLKAAAQRFGAESQKVQADLKEGRLPPAVAQLFHGGLKPSKPNEPTPKRRRM